MTMMPDYDRAAIAAMQLLIDRKITETPIDPLPILKNYPGVRVMSFSRMADEAGIDREDLIPMVGKCMDACTFKLDMHMKDVEYVVVYNMRLPFEIVWRGVARELGHIVLGHDGSRTIEARMAEAMCFSHHLLSPRPILRMIQDAGVPFTLDVLANTTGCIDECVHDMQSIPATHVPSVMNRQVKEQFSRGINEYLRFYAASPKKDQSPLLNFGTFMDGYEE